MRFTVEARTCFGVTGYTVLDMVKERVVFIDESRATANEVAKVLNEEVSRLEAEHGAPTTNP